MKKFLIKWGPTIAFGAVLGEAFDYDQWIPMIIWLVIYAVLSTIRDIHA